MVAEYSRVCFTNNAGGVPQASYDSINQSDRSARAIKENPRNGTLNLSSLIGSVHSETADDVSLRLAITTSKLWNSGRVLKVHFKTGSNWQREKVKIHAPLWSQFANIKFDFDIAGTPDILVDFNPALGSWSTLGTNSSYPISHDPPQPSMNLGWILDSKSEADIRQVILHEFGHALGAIHEHTSPFASIPWNKEQVYKDLGGPPNGWSKGTVDTNMFTVFAALENPATAFDPASIMLYQYPKTWTIDGKGTANNTTLSVRDKAFIAFCYPQDEYDAGQFNTQQIHSQLVPTPTTESVLYFYKKHSSITPLAYGLNWLDVDKGADIRIKAVVSDIQQDRFTAALESWEDTKLYAAGMTWLEVSRFPFLQTGAFNTEEVRPWNQPRAKTSKRVDFKASFSSPPRVVCFFTSLHMSNEYDFCAKAFPSDIDNNGFTINISAWSDTILYSGGATWLAYPSDQLKIASGRFSTAEVGPLSKPQADNSTTKEWGMQFSKVPKVFMALDELSYGREKNLRCRLSTSSVTPTELTWHLQSWEDSIMYQSGASYFAWEEAQ
ncbi:hypothetical protein MMC18_009016 [Xylographa bjoerkii]|nr:hypothetical protein [Xylographa bjoerkii]